MEIKNNYDVLNFYKKEIKKRCDFLELRKENSNKEEKSKIDKVVSIMNASLQKIVNACMDSDDAFEPYTNDYKKI